MRMTILMENTPGVPGCQVEHGLSVYVETEGHRLLIDSGQSPACLENAKILGVDLGGVDTVVLSHGHYDHAGGLMAFARQNPRAKIYLQRSALGDYYHMPRYIGIDKAIGSLPQAVLLEGDCEIDGELSLFTGIAGRRFFAKGNRLLTQKVEGALIPDQFGHEQCLVVTQGERRYLFSGCAHNGILNILDRYRQIYAEDPAAVVSGFHMMERGAYDREEREAILETARILAEMDTVFYTGHCTGPAALELMAPILGDKLQVLHTGLTVEL